MSISGLDLLDIEDELRDMVDVLKQRNEIEKDLRVKSDR